MTKNLCHHIEHTLFDLWLKYEQFQQVLLLSTIICLETQV
jgi:hypothetical protein